eukprot:GHVN01083612.1.p1 GENE.GHVN01083612.1~~GHVN01083612.1.p1  ORF type:complete len:103 (+),score=5.49 GHVN01083612.1:250-558(+)
MAGLTFGKKKTGIKNLVETASTIGCSSGRRIDIKSVTSEDKLSEGKCIATIEESVKATCNGEELCKVCATNRTAEVYLLHSWTQALSHETPASGGPRRLQYG